MSHVFISYSKKDRVYARTLADHLLSLGFDVWIDDRIDYGDDWWSTIVRAIQTASAFVVIMTDESDSSKWVQREVTLADKRNIPTFPLWLSGDFDNSANWAIFVRTQYADVRNGKLPHDNYFERLTQYTPHKSHPGENVTVQRDKSNVAIADINPVIRKQRSSPASKPQKIYISYSSKDKAIVMDLGHDLIASSYTVWFDRELTGKRQWWANILRQIRDCDLFLFALTEQSLNSVPCQSEYGYASALAKRILPVRMGDINISILPQALQMIQFVDYRLRDKNRYFSLINALNTLPSPSPLPDPLPLEPPIPLSPLAELSERIDAPNLTIDLQKTLVYDLTTAYRDSETVVDAQALIKRLLRREKELNAHIYQDLTLLLAKLREPLLIVEPGGNVISVALSSDGRWIATADEFKTIMLWEVKGGRKIREFIGHTGQVFSVVFSSRGNYILSGSEDTTLRLWETSSGREIRQFIGHEKDVWSVAFSPDTHFVLSGSFDRTLRLWETSSGREIRQFIGHENTINCVAFSPDGQMIVSGSEDTTLRLWETSSGREIRQFIGHEDTVNCVAFSPDGQMIVSGSEDTTLRLWETSSGREIRQFIGHKHWVTSVAFSPDGRFIISSGFNNELLLWEVASGNQIHQFEGHDGVIWTVTFSRDGHTFASCSDDGTARIWPLYDII